MSASLFPLFADVRDRAVLVVGGGAVAARKVEALLEAGARVRVGSPALEPRLAAWRDAGRIEHLRDEFHDAWLDAVWLAIAATDDAAVNRAVARAAEARRIFANVVDEAELSSVQVPALVRRGPLAIAISSGGAAPMLARLLRERIETEVDESWGELACLLATERAAIRAARPDPAQRRAWYAAIMRGPIPGLLRAGRRAQAHTRLRASLRAPAPAASGRVALVGAGPGDAGLLTLRALRLLNEADVILHDRLVSAEVLALARRDAERIEVGKQAGNHHTTQARIHELMLARARAGRFVVRLKGGDPFVFGRGGEELEALRAAGIDYEVVPGISAALACAAYAGVPLTHRAHAQSVRFVTAHQTGTNESPDWSALATERQTLAIYMGVAGLADLQRGLLARGRNPGTPFALVENGTRRDQRVIVGTLAELAERAQAHAVRSPALLLLGEVAAFARSLHWFGAAPLGRRDTLDAAA